MPRPELSAVFDPAGMLATARSIASVQHASGEIPWFEGGHSDPWDHIECAMALAVGGLRDEAVAAYEFLRVTQRPDGSWPTKVRAGVVEDPSFETNQCAYIAVGVWAIVRGVSELSAATRPRGGVEGEGWLVLSGLLSIGLGLLVIFMPHIGAPVLAWLIGLYGLADGLVMVGLSLRIRHVGELVEGVRTHVRGPEPGLT